MRQNNPEIADLSDTNRPTKIAERFSELYDNEWTEAFEKLTRKNKTEKEIINYLLSIVKVSDYEIDGNRYTNYYEDIFLHNGCSFRLKMN